MIAKLRYAAVKVRLRNSGQLQETEKFSGTVTYSVVGSLNDRRVRLALGTESARIAGRLVEKLKTVSAAGPESSVWLELEEALPRKSFDFFANEIGYVRTPKPSAPDVRPTWRILSDAFAIEMSRLIANKERGASRNEGVMSPTTRDRYLTTLKHFGEFMKSKQIEYVGSINPSLIEQFKISRREHITSLKQGRGGSSIALDVAILHRVFRFAIRKGMMAANPINLSEESKPGENPKNGARHFTAAELTAMRKVAGPDLFAFIVLRWTGLRVSDAVNLSWENVHFDRGVNGEIEVLTQKRSKTAIVPLSPELAAALQAEFRKVKPRPEDSVLINPETGKSFTGRARLYHRMKSLGNRAGVNRVTPHCFRDTFVCDMLARGASTYHVGQMVADTTETIEKAYASFVQAARDAVQGQMANGLGIEERAKLAAQRGRRVVNFPTTVRQGG